MSLNHINPETIQTAPFHENGEVYEFDYSHILPEELRQDGYSLEVTDDDCGHVQGNIRHDGAQLKVVGNLSGYMKDNALTSEYAHVDPMHRRRGLATAAHEAMIMHAKAELGATHLAGSLHGSFSPVAHTQIAQKHGLMHRPNRIEKTEIVELIDLDGKPLGAMPLFKNTDPLMERIKHGSVEERSMALTEPGITEDHLAQAAKDRSKTVLSRVLGHPLCTPEFISLRVPDNFIKSMITELLPSMGTYYGPADPNNVGLAKCRPQIESPEALKRVWSVLKTMTAEDFPSRSENGKRQERMGVLRRLSKIYMTPKEVLADFPFDDPDYDDSTRIFLQNHPNADPARAQKMLGSHLADLMTIEPLLKREYAGEDVTPEEKELRRQATKRVERNSHTFREAINNGKLGSEMIDKLALMDSENLAYRELGRSIEIAQSSGHLSKETFDKIFDKRLDAESRVPAGEGRAWGNWSGFISNNKHMTPDHNSRLLDVPTTAIFGITSETLKNPELENKVLKILRGNDLQSDFVEAVSNLEWTPSFHSKMADIVSQNFIPSIAEALMDREVRIPQQLSQHRNDADYYRGQLADNPDDEDDKKNLAHIEAQIKALSEQPQLSAPQIMGIYKAVSERDNKVRALQQRREDGGDLTAEEDNLLDRGVSGNIYRAMRKLTNVPPDLRSALVKQGMISGDEEDLEEFKDLSDTDKVEVISQVRRDTLSGILRANSKVTMPDAAWDAALKKLGADDEDEYGENASLGRALARSKNLPERHAEFLAETTRSYNCYTSLYDPSTRIITPRMMELMKNRLKRPDGTKDRLNDSGAWSSVLEKLMDKENFQPGYMNEASPVTPAFLEETYAIEPLLSNVISESDFAPSNILEKIIETDDDSGVVGKAFANKNLSSDYFDRALSQKLPPNTLYAILSNNRLSSEKISKIITANPEIKHIDEDSPEFEATRNQRDVRANIRSWNKVALRVADHPNTPSEWIDQKVAEVGADPNNALGGILRKRLSDDRPSMLFPGKTIKVKLGSQKLRIMRDMILDSGKKEIPMSELPQGNWEKYRVITGDPKIDKQKLVSADKIQEAIDAIPEHTFHYHLSTWEYATFQRHRTDIPSDVFQLQLGDDHVKKIKDRGLWSEWKRYRDGDISSHTVHPPYMSGMEIAKSALGWMRLTGTRDMAKTGTVHADEVQCDYRQAGGGGGGDEDEDGNASDWAVPNAVMGALFGNMDPHEVIMEAHAQYLRDQGLSHVMVHFPNLEFRGSLHPMEGFEPDGAVPRDRLPPKEVLQIKSEKIARLAHVHAAARTELANQIAQLEGSVKEGLDPKAKAIALNKLQGANKSFKQLMNGFLGKIGQLTTRAKLSILPERGVRYRNTADKICRAIVASHTALTNLKEFDIDGLRREHKDLLEKLATETDVKAKKTMEGQANAMHRKITQHPANIKQLESNHAENLASMHDLLKIDPKLKDSIGNRFDRHLPAHYFDTYEKLPIKFASVPAKYGDEATETNTKKYGGYSMWKYKTRKFEDVENNLYKSLKDVPDGKILNNNGQMATVDYSHVLPPELRQQGYGLRLKIINRGRRIGSGGDSTGITADITKGGQFIGGANGAVYGQPNGERHLDIELSDVEDAHQRKGLGTAAYEAMMAFSHNVLKATHVAGGQHSSLVSKLHGKLAQKHGMEYIPAPAFPSKEFPNEDAWNAKKDGPYDAKWAPYKYLMKAALSEIERPSTLDDNQVGDATPDPFVSKSYDYSHLLPDNVGNAYKLIVQRRKKSMGNTFGLDANLLFKGTQVGSVGAVVRIANGKMYLAESDLDEEHRGRGYGKALYKALYAHAANDLKVKSVDGESHSDAARKVHESLAREYGFNYSAEPNIVGRPGGEGDGYANTAEWSENGDRPFNGRWGSYDYDLKPKG